MRWTKSCQTPAQYQDPPQVHLAVSPLAKSTRGYDTRVWLMARWLGRDLEL